MDFVELHQRRLILALFWKRDLEIEKENAQSRVLLLKDRSWPKQRVQNDIQIDRTRSQSEVDTNGFIFLICFIGARVLPFSCEVFLLREWHFHISSLPDCQYVGSLLHSQCIHLTKRLKRAHRLTWVPFFFHLHIIRCRTLHTQQKVGSSPQTLYNDGGRRKKDCKPKVHSPSSLRIIHLKV